MKKCKEIDKKKKQKNTNKLRKAKALTIIKLIYVVLKYRVPCTVSLFTVNCIVYDNLFFSINQNKFNTVTCHTHTQPSRGANTIR